ncbi:MAG: nucleotide exchange factor GrpE [Candidatus Woesearchaeota archaeon]|nr:nucleotide exchange factor GrpE [Candidatus Woesearchaeota archaeon]
MVFDKIREAFSKTDEKYEILYYKYSQIKMENIKLKEKHTKEMQHHKEKVHEIMAKHLINLYEDVETAKSDSFKVKASDKETQRLLISLNKVEKDMKSVMTNFSIETYDAEDRMFDPELHEIASYQDAKGMKKGIIINTVKKGFKYRNNIIKKPKVLVTK